MDRTFNSSICICFVSIFLTIVCVMHGGVTIIHKSYSQQRNTTIPLDEQATTPYLSITMQTLKDPEGFSSTGSDTFLQTEV